MSGATKAKPQAAATAETRPQMGELRLAFRHVFRTLSRLRGRDTHLQGSELSHAQFELLIELDERGDLSAGELAAAARLTPATVTQMLDHLAACGHVQRLRSESDRRVVVSRLTAQGRARVAAKRSVWQSRWQEALGDFSERDLWAATRVLQRLGEMLEETSPQADCSAAEQAVQSASQSPG
jgi:DNA-binding MarR family transcriptional regulator